MAIGSEIALPKARLRLHVGSQRQQRKRVPVVRVRQVEHLRETSAGAILFMPAAVGKLRIEQVLNCLFETRAPHIAAREKPQNGPRRLRGGASGLGGCTRIRDEAILVVTCAAFTPAAIAVLISTDEFKCLLNAGLAIAHSSRLQTAQRQ